MTDVVGLDFLFSDITDVSFASGGIFAVIAGFAVDPGGTAGGNSSINFPQQAGGTPGFTLTTGASPVLGGPATKAFTAKDFQLKARTGAGLGLTGVIPMSFKTNAVAVLNLQQVLFFVGNSPFGKPFQLGARIDTVGSVGFENAFLEVLVWKKRFKVGATFDIRTQPYPGTIPPVDAADVISTSSGGVATGTFQIDLKQGTVSH